jgi:hypothetical protein
MEPRSAECRKHCADITGRTAELAAELLLDRGAVAVPVGRRIAGRDLANAALPAAGLAAVAVAGFFGAVVLTGAAASGPSAIAFGAVAFLAAYVWTLWRATRVPGRR